MILFAPNFSTFPPWGKKGLVSFVVVLNLSCLFYSRLITHLTFCCSHFMKWFIMAHIIVVSSGSFWSLVGWPLVVVSISSFGPSLPTRLVVTKKKKFLIWHLCVCARTRVSVFTHCHDIPITVRQLPGNNGQQTRESFALCRLFSFLSRYCWLSLFLLSFSFT